MNSPSDSLASASLKKSTFCFVSQSQRVPFPALQKIAAAVSRQLIEDVAPAWRVSVPAVVAAHSVLAAPHDSIVFTFLEDDPSTPGAGGWHTEDQTGRIFAEVLIAPYLDNGGTLMTGANSVSVVASHEAIETLLDPFCVLYAIGPDSRLYPVEGCDAVQGFSYVKAGVAVSDFLLPAFFDAESADPHGDFLKLGLGPFKTAPSGYQAILDPGQLTDATEQGARLDAIRKAVEVKDFDAARLATIAAAQLPAGPHTAHEWGSNVPKWLREHKEKHGARFTRRAARTNRRTANKLVMP